MPAYQILVSARFSGGSPASSGVAP